MSSNIPSAPAYGVCISAHFAMPVVVQIIVTFYYATGSVLVTRLLFFCYKINCLSNIFKKFYGRHTDLGGQYKKHVCQMFAYFIRELIFIFYGSGDGGIDKIS